MSPIHKERAPSKARWAASLNHIRLLRLEVALVFRKDLPLRGFSGFSLRGALGRACALADGDRRNGERREGGLYEEVFKSARVEAGSNLQPPPPFTILAPHRPYSGLKRGQTLTFGLLLFGAAAKRGLDVIAALQCLGLREGLTQAKVPFDVLYARALTPKGPLCLWGRERRRTFPEVEPGWLVTGSELVSQHTMANLDDLQLMRLSFDVPISLRDTAGSLPKDIPLVTLASSIWRSADAYGQHYGTGGMEIPFQTATRRAERFSMAHRALRKVTLRRRSFRGDKEGKVISIPCYAGSVAYRGPVSSILPLLALGETLGVGRNRCMGLGRYRLSLSR